MDVKDRQSYMDLRTHYSTRRYTYEGYGGQKHDKTLILHKSETCSNDTIVLRLCKRLGGRIAFSSCFRGKLFLAVTVALMAIFCYFNLFSSYLPKACEVFAVRRSHKLKSLQNETVYIRTRNSLSEKLDYLNPILSKSQLVSTFTKKVAFESWQRTISTTINQRSKATLMDPNAVFGELSVTSPTQIKEINNLEKVDYMDLNAQQQPPFLVEMQEYKSFQSNEDALISRIVKAGKAASMD